MLVSNILKNAFFAFAACSLTHNESHSQFFCLLRAVVAIDLILFRLHAIKLFFEIVQVSSVFLEDWHEFGLGSLNESKFFFRAGMCLQMLGLVRVSFTSSPGIQLEYDLTIGRVQSALSIASVSSQGHCEVEPLAVVKVKIIIEVGVCYNLSQNVVFSEQKRFKFSK